MSHFRQSCFFVFRCPKMFSMGTNLDIFSVLPTPSLNRKTLKPNYICSYRGLCDASELLRKFFSRGIWLEECRLVLYTYVCKLSVRRKWSVYLVSKSVQLTFNYLQGNLLQFSLRLANSAYLPLLSSNCLSIIC